MHVSSRWDPTRPGAIIISSCQQLLLRLNVTNFQRQQSQPSQSINSLFQALQNVYPSFRRYRKVLKRRKELSENSELRAVLLRVAANIIQLLNKDFYHLSAAALEVKSNTPNNVAFKVTGKSTHEKATSGLVRGILST